MHFPYKEDAASSLIQQKPFRACVLALSPWIGLSLGEGDLDTDTII